jgi:hypothetical protein
MPALFSDYLAYPKATLKNRQPTLLFRLARRFQGPDGECRVWQGTLGGRVKKAQQQRRRRW